MHHILVGHTVYPEIIILEKSRDESNQKSCVLMMVIPEKDTKSRSKVKFPTTEKIPITRKRNVR